MMMKKRLQRLWTLAKRFWRIYVNPPPESKISLELSSILEVGQLISRSQTVSEPKQVEVSSKWALAIVPGMKGRKLQFFDLTPGDINLRSELGFEDQCVEAVAKDDYCYVTSTNFARNGELRNYLNIVDLRSLELVSRVSTGGNWCKFIKIHPNGRLAFVSNWHSNSISIIDITDKENPSLLQHLPCGDSPRGIDITNDGRTVLVACYYSRNIIELSPKNENEYYVSYCSPVLDTGSYSGNLRDILISPNQEIAFVSNMGLNMVNVWSLKDRRFLNSVRVGKFPNSIAFAVPNANILLVSCRESNAVCFVDTERLEPIAKVLTAGNKPTGLSPTSEGFAVTCFESDTIELYRYSLLELQRATKET